MADENFSSDFGTDKAGEQNVALKELSNVTAQSLTPNVATFFSNLYKRCMDAEKKRKQEKPGYQHTAMSIFKNELNNIMKWESKEATQRADEIRKVNSTVEGLLEDIVLGHFNLLRNVRAKKVKSFKGKTLERPTFAHFILKVFKRVASKLYQNPDTANIYTLQDAVNELRINDLMSLVRESIKEVLKTIVPIEKMLGTLDQIKKEQVDLERLQAEVNQQQQQPVIQQQQPPQESIPDDFASTPPGTRKANDTDNTEEEEEEEEEEQSDLKPIPSKDIGDMHIEEAIQKKLTTISGSGFAPVKQPQPQQLQPQKLTAPKNDFDDDE